jgi:hypothetical protein
MKLNIKQYKYEKVEIEVKEIDLPTEVSYYFETGVRRSIKITPVFTSWNKERFNKEEELYCLEIICLYNSSECKAEKFTINTKEIETIFYSEKHKYKGFVDSLVNDWFDVRTKEQFEADFNYTFNEMQS